METKKTKKIIEVLEMISSDMEQDAKNLDGKPFTGKTVATQFGYHGAAIKALADTLKTVVKDSFLFYLLSVQLKNIMEIGQKIKVYSDPLIESKLEGTAVLVVKATPGTSKKGFEVWEVRFPGKGKIVNRIVHDRNIDRSS